MRGVAMRFEGLLSQWDDAKGYGFITPRDGAPKLFVHVKAFALQQERPRQGMALSFEVGHDAQGKKRALKVRPLSTKAQAPKPVVARRSANHLWLVPVFATFYLACHIAWGLRPGVWGLYMALSMATFIVYFGDKRAAARNQWRVAENTLHLLALAGGWPGALLAQHLLRHKSAKPDFRRVFWFTVVANWVLFVLICSPWLRAWWERG